MAVTVTFGNDSVTYTLTADQETDYNTRVAASEDLTDVENALLLECAEHAGTVTTENYGQITWTSS